MLRAVAIKLVSCIDNDFDNDLTNLSLVSTSLPPSVPSQDELKKIRDLEKKIVAQGEHSKKVFERKIKIRGLESEMKKNKAEQDEKIQTLEETVTVQRKTIEKQNSKISELEEKSQSQDKKITELEEKLEEKSQSQDKKITELEERFQSLCQYINPTISTMITQIEDLSSH